MTGKELKSRLAKTGYLEKIASALNLPVSALIEANGDVVAAIDHSTAKIALFCPKTARNGFLLLVWVSYKVC